MNKYIFFLGKGGVGKSTLSTAMAKELSGSKKVLHVSLDPAHNLGDIYGTTLTDKETEISPGLYALEVSLARWIERYLKWSRDEISSQYRYNLTLNLDSFFDILKYSPGTEEYAVLWALENICRDKKGEFGYIVFDTPPTALSLRFLAMPTLSIRWIRELTKMREATLSKRQTILRINPESEAVRGASTKEDDPVYKKLGSLRSRLDYMYSLFTLNSYFVVVVNEDKLSLSESIRIKDELEKLDIPVSALCINKTGCMDKDETSDKVKEIFPRLPRFYTEIIQGGIMEIEDIKGIDIKPLVDHYLSLGG